MFSKNKIYKSIENYSDNIKKLKEEIKMQMLLSLVLEQDFQRQRGYTYNGDCFDKYFSDFKEKYGIQDMYSGGFYPYPNMETFWGFWARNIYVNRYDQPESEVYKNLLKLVYDKDYFVITTNVDHQFQLAGFDKKDCSICKVIMDFGNAVGHAIK